MPSVYAPNVYVTCDRVTTSSVRVEQQALRPVLGGVGVGVRAGPTLCEQVAVHGENPLRPLAHQQF